MAGKVISPSFSLKGWKFKKWFTGNWSTIKELIKVFVPMALGWTATHSPELTGLITIGGKFLMDVGEYYFKQYTE